jgi:hypothetical protein
MERRTRVGLSLLGKIATGLWKVLADVLDGVEVAGLVLERAFPRVVTETLGSNN